MRIPNIDTLDRWIAYSDEGAVIGSSEFIQRDHKQLAKFLRDFKAAAQGVRIDVFRSSFPPTVDRFEAKEQFTRVTILPSSIGGKPSVSAFVNEIDGDRPVDVTYVGPEDGTLFG